MTGPPDETDVLVVGGGLVGLAAAALLARTGTRVLLAERHPAPSMHPKARLVTVRSMEIYRALGLERAVLDAGEPNTGFAVADTLAGPHESWVAPPADEVSAGDLSPCRPWSCDQQRIEPILRARAVELGADVRFGAAVTDLHAGVDTDSGVRATVAGRPVRARFAVVADGARGAVATGLGIGRHGVPEGDAPVGTAVSAVFRADLDAALRGRAVGALMARAAGAFLFARGTPADRTWQLGTHLRPEWDPARLAEHVVDVIRAATGLHGLEPQVEGVLTWTAGAHVADRFCAGPVLLAGDAAHVMPPYGGFGGNTGVADAHALAWRLARACRDTAVDSATPAGEMLDGYDAERRPLAELTVGQAVLRSRTAPGTPPPAGRIDATRLVLGFRYGPCGEPTQDPADPDGAPGTRAPHVRLVDGRSTLDLLDPVRCVRISATAGEPVPTHRERWARCYGAAGLLVRPDGVVAPG